MKLVLGYFDTEAMVQMDPGLVGVLMEPVCVGVFIEYVWILEEVSDCLLDPVWFDLL